MVRATGLTTSSSRWKRMDTPQYLRPRSCHAHPPDGGRQVDYAGSIVPPETGGSRATSCPSASGDDGSARSPSTTADPAPATFANRSPNRSDNARTTSATVSPSASTRGEPASSRSAANSRTVTWATTSRLSSVRGPLYPARHRDARGPALRSLDRRGASGRPADAPGRQDRATVRPRGDPGALARTGGRDRGRGREPGP